MRLVMPSLSQRGLLVSGVCLLFIGWNFGISVLIKWAMSPKGANYLVWGDLWP